MDVVFEEEREKLQKTESVIKNEIKKHEAESKRLVDELNNYDPDGGLSPSKEQLREGYQKEDKLVEELTNYLPEPYFGRMDLDEENSTKTKSYYIGKSGIRIGSTQLVIDWRSDVGGYFYMKSERSFDVDGYRYQLALRRAFDIKNGELSNYDTEFDNTNVSLEGDVMDPFLIKVLRDKRRENRLTDIIRTIQGKQNDIIRKPREEQFVVQGCAGSGKTMILLHRLSYLKFNNRDLNWSNVKIITPNKAFEAHINDLSVQLGLDEIERVSVEEYYVQIIKAYSDKINVSGDVESEKGLSSDLLSSIYSREYKEKMEADYENKWLMVISAVEASPLGELIRKYELKSPNYAVHTQSTYSELVSTIKNVRMLFDKQQDEIRTMKERIEHERSLIDENYEEINLERAKYLSIVNSTMDSIEGELTKTQKLKEEANIQILQIRQDYDKLSAELQDAKKAHNTAQKEYQSYLIKQGDYADFEVFAKRVGSGDETAKLLVMQFNKEYDEILSLIEKHKNTPLYRFVARNQLNEAIKEKKKAFISAILSYIEDVSEPLKRKAEKAEMEFTEINERYNSFADEKKKKEGQYSRLTTYIEALTLAADKINSGEVVDLEKELTNEQLWSVENIVNNYVSLASSMLKANKKIEIYSSNEREETEKLAELEKNKITDAEMSEIMTASTEIEKLKLSNFMNDIVIGGLRSIYKECGERYTKNNYRHKLYLKLLFCSLYFSSKRIYDSFVNIDEAQDISISEYALLRKVLGPNCIFNLYGDVNQLVYSYKGISDWSLISEIVGDNVYVLNENYRNTLQITQYCNDVFNSEVYPIGVTGDDVEEKNLEDSVDWIEDIKKKNPSTRCAIIYRHGKRAILEELHSMLKENYVSWNAVDDSKLSVITVEMAKGLEFDAVVSVTDSMTVNERYISFTRALNNLCVVDETFVEEGVGDEGYISEDEEEILVTDDELNAEENVEVIAPEPEMGVAEVASNITETKINEAEDSIDFVTETLQTLFDEPVNLSDSQRNLINSLDAGVHTACSAQSGSLKSLIFMTMVLKERRETGKQGLITAERFLQENELVMAERLGLNAGFVSETAEELIKDVKKDKYDIIFVPYDFLDNYEEANTLLRFLDGKIKYWGLDHPLAYEDNWDVIKDYGKMVNATFYLMSKEGFGEMNLEGYHVYELDYEGNAVEVENHEYSSVDEKLEWFDKHLEVFDGVGIIYCDLPETCKMVSKYLRKRKVKAPEYIDVNNEELMHYLTNSFISGGIKTLITTHELGKNLSNPKIGFIIHFDMPNPEIAKVHEGQISNIAKEKRMINFDIS